MTRPAGEDKEGAVLVAQWEPRQMAGVNLLEEGPAKVGAESKLKVNSNNLLAEANGSSDSTGVVTKIGGTAGDARNGTSKSTGPPTADSTGASSGSGGSAQDKLGRVCSDRQGVAKVESGGGDGRAEVHARDSGSETPQHLAAAQTSKIERSDEDPMVGDAGLGGRCRSERKGRFACLAMQSPGGDMVLKTTPRSISLGDAVLGDRAPLGFLSANELMAQNQSGDKAEVVRLDGMKRGLGTDSKGCIKTVDTALDTGTPGMHALGSAVIAESEESAAIHVGSFSPRAGRSVRFSMYEDYRLISPRKGVRFDCLCAPQSCA